MRKKGEDMEVSSCLLCGVEYPDSATGDNYFFYCNRCKGTLYKKRQKKVKKTIVENTQNDSLGRLQ